MHFNFNLTEVFLREFFSNYKQIVVSLGEKKNLDIWCTLNGRAKRN